MTMQRKIYQSVLLALCSAIVLLNSACAPVAIGSMVATGMVASDRRTPGIQLEDEGIESRAGDALTAIANRGHINITSYSLRVLLTGEVASEADRKNAERLVAQTQNVQGVINELAVMGSSSMTERASDSLVTGKVKASFVDAKDLYANAFKVVTERGTVYLMGRVTQREANRAAEVASHVPGVQKVVRVFEYITEEQLKEELPKAPPPKPQQ